MKSWPQMTWISCPKTLPKVCGVNYFINLTSKDKVNSKHPCCPHPDKTTEHLLLCQNPARTKLYHHSVNKLGQWMASPQTDLLILFSVLNYLKGRKQLTMRACYGAPQSHNLLGWILVQAHDCLGWRNFIKRSIACKYKSIQCKYSQNISSRRLS